MATFPDHQIAKWLEDLKVEQPLEYQNDSRYVDLFDDPSGNGPTLRGKSIGASIMKSIKLRQAPTCQFFSGYVGTGKSTELKVLQHRLETFGYKVLYVDFSQFHDLNHKLEIVDFCFLIAGAFGEAAGKLLGDPMDKPSYWSRLKSFVTKTEISLDELKLKVPGVDLKSTLRHGDAEFWDEARKRLSGSIGILKREAHEHIEDWRTKLLNKFPNSAGIVFILDSLERLRGNEFRFVEVMESIIDLINDHHDFLQIPNCHTVITVPPYTGFFGKALQKSFGGRSHKPLPAVKVIDRKTREPYKAGVEAMIKVLGKRVDLDAIFGTTHRQCLEDLVFNSAGHLKTALLFLQSLIFDLAGSDTGQIPRITQNILADFKEEANNAVRPEDIPALELIRRETSLENLTRDQLYSLSRFIDSNYVLCYQNGEGWFQVHPLLMDNVARRAKDLREEDVE